MTNITIDIRGLEAALRELEDVPQEMRWAVDLAVRRAAEEAVRDMRREAPKAQSTLVNSIRSQKLGQADYRVGPGVDYARAVEEGTRGGRIPPFRNIHDWVRTVIRPDEAQARDIAWAVAKAIQRRGTPAQPFVRPVADSPQLRRRLIALVRDAIRASLPRS